MKPKTTQEAVTELRDAAAHLCQELAREVRADWRKLALVYAAIVLLAWWLA